jgi:hypothetical protein
MTARDAPRRLPGRGPIVTVHASHYRIGSTPQRRGIPDGTQTALPDRPAHRHDRCRSASGLSTAATAGGPRPAPGVGHAPGSLRAARRGVSLHARCGRPAGEGPVFTLLYARPGRPGAVLGGRCVLVPPFRRPAMTCASFLEVRHLAAEEESVERYSNERPYLQCGERPHRAGRPEWWRHKAVCISSPTVGARDTCGTLCRTACEAMVKRTFLLP